jgi:hypothetical protein
MFRISDLRFKIEAAFVDSFIDEDEMTLNFGLEIFAVCTNPGFENWKARAQNEIFTVRKAGEITNWKNLDSKEITWTEKYDEEGEMYGSLYIFEHNPVYESSLIFGIENEQFKIDWIGKTDVNWDEKYGQNLDIEIRTIMPFKGIWCANKSEEDSLKLVGRFCNPEEFKYTQTKDGVSLLTPK